MKKVLIVAGARPNFMKIAPIFRALENSSQLEGILVHTGQHYDQNMSANFFSDLGIKKPDINLEVGSGSHAEQTAKIMIAFEKVCLEQKPDMVLVVGDVNSTVATGLVAKKLQIPLSHVEAGLRSGDRNMPEEINRLATDAITDLFFTTEKNGTENLLSEGVSQDKVHFVGHVMIDNLFYQKEKIKSAGVSEFSKKLKEMLPAKYICMTLHRPSNVDSQNLLTQIMSKVESLASHAPILFPCHPRTRQKLEQFGLDKNLKIINDKPEPMEKGVYLTGPMGYNDFLNIWQDTALLITDSGGMQEETTALKIPCVTLRDSTERPITCEVGSNILIPDNYDQLDNLIPDALAGKWKESRIPDLWDGKASERIVQILDQFLN